MIKDILKPKSREEIEKTRGFDELMKKFNIVPYGNQLIKDIKLHAFFNGHWNPDTEKIKIRRTSISIHDCNYCIKLSMYPPVRAITGANHLKNKHGDIYTITSFDEYKMISDFLSKPNYRVYRT